MREFAVGGSLEGQGHIEDPSSEIRSELRAGLPGGLEEGLGVVGEGLGASWDQLVAGLGVDYAEQEFGGGEILSQRGDCNHGFSFVSGSIIFGRQSPFFGKHELSCHKFVFKRHLYNIPL